MVINHSAAIRRKSGNHIKQGFPFRYVVLTIAGLFMALPMVYTIVNSLKPLDELFVFPPRFFVRNPTTDNFMDLFRLTSDLWVPFSRYFLNTVIITACGTTGQVLLASMAAYALAKRKFPGRQFFFRTIVLSLMFSSHVTMIPNYLIIAKLHLVDTYLALIVPAFQSSLGLYLIKQFMESGVPDSLIEAARIDGAREWRIFWKIVMPVVKPAWITLIILCVQNLWNTTGSTYLYSEQLKPLPVAMSQIAAGGIARAGVSAAVGVVMMIVPVTIFIFMQSRVMETMATSGMKD